MYGITVYLVLITVAAVFGFGLWRYLKYHGYEQSYHRRQKRENTAHRKLMAERVEANEP